MRVREYAGPLGVLAAGVLGLSLLCSVSALATGDLNTHSFRAMQPLNIVDLAVANLSTSVALTQQAVAAFVSTPTSLPSEAASLTPGASPPNTATVPASPASLEPTRTRRSRTVSTARPLPTQIPVPAATSTSLPPTNTPLPPPTDTPLPPPTDTEPPPTSAPPPADTVPAPTDPPVQILDATPTASS